MEKEAFDKRHPDNVQLRQERSGDAFQAIYDIQREFDTKHQANDELFNQNPADWRAQRAELNKSEFDQIQGVRRGSPDDFKELEPRTRVDVLNNVYSTLIKSNTDDTNRVNWNIVDRVMSSWSAADQDLFFQQRLAGNSNLSKAYLFSIKQLTPYFEQRDMSWKKLQQSNAEFQQFKTFDDYYDNLVVKHMETGLPRTVAQAVADRQANSIEKLLSAESTIFLSQNPQLVRLLDRWGFYVPAALRGLTLP